MDCQGVIHLSLQVPWPITRRGSPARDTARACAVHGEGLRPLNVVAAAMRWLLLQLTLAIALDVIAERPLRGDRFTGCLFEIVMLDARWPLRSTPLSSQVYDN